MNSKQKQTLHNIFENPVRSDIRWSNIEKLFLALGAKIDERKGSRVCIFLNGTTAVFHRPHPQDSTDRNAVRDVREFLVKAGISDAEI